MTLWEEKRVGAHVRFSRSFSQLWVLCEINLMIIYWSPLSPFPNQLRCS